jgi:hypothetical protein
MNASQLILAFVAAAAVIASGGTRAQSDGRSPFDGAWDVTLTCAPYHEDDDAKGYVHRFPAEIRNGVLRGVYGTEGEPGWSLLTGSIAGDGSAALTLEGIVNNPAYSVNNAQRGKPYVNRVRAHFEPAAGTGQRVGKRKCDFAFKRR